MSFQHPLFPQHFPLKSPSTYTPYTIPIPPDFTVPIPDTGDIELHPIESIQRSLSTNKNMLEFNTINISDDKLDTWIRNDLNVCFIGKHGTAKSTSVINAFNRNNLKWKYFSGATLDPWVDVVGVPTVIERDNKKILDFILPEGMDENLEAIFCDEYNRTHKTVRNALLELVQFKSINGKKFPKLKIIWVAINPYNETNETEEYDVEKIDYAQLDRFHIIVKVSDIPNRSYFYEKFKEKGDVAIEWYKSQSDIAKTFLSPRRLEYVLEAFFKGVNIRDMLPEQCNIAELVNNLNKDTETANYEIAIQKKNKKALGKILSNMSSWEKFKSDIIKRRCWNMLEYVNAEILSTFINENKSFKSFIFHHKDKTDFCRDIHDNLVKIHQEAFKDVNISKNIDNKVIKIVQSGITPCSFDEAAENWRWKSYLSPTGHGLKNMNTIDKQNLYKSCVSCIHDINSSEQLEPYFTLLQGIDRCQKGTIKNFKHLVEFIQIVGGYAQQFGLTLPKIDFIHTLIKNGFIQTKITSPSSEWVNNMSVPFVDDEGILSHINWKPTKK